MIIGILKTLFNLAWTILKWPLIICGAIMLAYYLLCMGWILYYRLVKKIPKKKGEHYKVKEPKLVKEMEEKGLVGPANGSKPREIIHMP